MAAILSRPQCFTKPYNYRIYWWIKYNQTHYHSMSLVWWLLWNEMLIYAGGQDGTQFKTIHIQGIITSNENNKQVESNEIFQ